MIMAVAFGAPHSEFHAGIGSRRRSRAVSQSTAVEFGRIPVSLRGAPRAGYGSRHVDASTPGRNGNADAS